MMQLVLWVHKGVLGSGATQKHTLMHFFEENQSQKVCGAKTPRTENEGKLRELILLRIRLSYHFKLS